MADRLKLTRNQLASFLKDHESIKQFERLFDVVDEIDTSTIGELQAASASTSNRSSAALNQAKAASEKSESIPLLLQKPENKTPELNYLDIDAAAKYVRKKGRAAWNSTYDTPEVGLSGDAFILVGQDLLARVHNFTYGAQIPAGMVCDFTFGTDANSVLVPQPFSAVGTYPSFFYLGVAASNIEDGDYGYCKIIGVIENIDTTGTPYGEVWAEGETVYASATNPGGYTNVKLSAPDLSVPLGIVLKVDATEGRLFIKPLIENAWFYGAYEKTADQVPALANTAYAVTLSTAQIEFGVSFGGGSQITFNQSGLFRCDVNVQLISTSGVQKDVWVWLRLNGTDIANTSRVVSLTQNNQYAQLVIGETIQISGGDVLEVFFASSSVAVAIKQVAATAFSPAASAAVVSLVQIAQ